MSDPEISPEITIVIPVYNEEGILHSAVVDLRERLSPFGWSYEILLARTVRAIARSPSPRSSRPNIPRSVTSARENPITARRSAWASSPRAVG